MPAVKIGRLGTSKHEQSNRIGTEILGFIKGWFTENNKTGCRFIIVDAYNNARTIKFYEKNGFTFLTGNSSDDLTRLMYFDLYTFRE